MSARFWASWPAAEYSALPRQSPARRRRPRPRLCTLGEHATAVVADIGRISTPDAGAWRRSPWPARRTPRPGAPAASPSGLRISCTSSVAPGDDVARAGMDVDDADVGHAAAAPALDDQLARAQRVVGGGQEGVAPPLHRRGAGVVGLAVEDHAACGGRPRSNRPRRWARRPPRAAGPARCAARRRRAPRPRARGASGARPASKPARAIASTRLVAVDGRHGRDARRRRADRRRRASRRGCRSVPPRHSTRRRPAAGGAPRPPRGWRAGTRGPPARRARRRACRPPAPCRCASRSPRRAPTR